MREPDRQCTVFCRTTLKAVEDAVRDRAEHWRALPASVATALLYARRLAAESDAAAPTVAQVVTILERYEHREEFSYSDARALERETGCFRELIKANPEAGALRDAIHATVEQHVALASAGIENLRETIADVAAELATMRERRAKQLAADLEAVTRQCEPTFLSLAGLMELLRILETARELFADPATKEARQVVPELHHTRAFRIVVVEDDEIWRSFAQRAVDVVRQELGQAFHVDTESFDNVQDALCALCPEETQRSPTAALARERSAIQTIAVVDMGLPANRQEALEVEAGLKTPLRRNGHGLLHALRTYRTNIPCIVFTTPPHLLDDQMRACEQGIQDCAYVLKGIDKQQHLVDAILGVIARAQGHRLEFWKTPAYEVRIDGIPIPMRDMPFRTFCALAELSGFGSCAWTPQQVLDQLDEAFADRYDYRRAPETDLEKAMVLARERSGDWWRSDWAMRIANVIRLWAARKLDANGDLCRALEELRQENFRNWQEALLLFDLYRRAHPESGKWSKQAERPVDRVNVAVLAAGFEEVFGGYQYEAKQRYDSANIEKHIHEIRTAIHAAFNAAHRFIEPREEILIGRPAASRSGYRVLGEINLHESEQFEEAGEVIASTDTEGDRLLFSGRETRCTVLIVENEGAYLERIRSLLEKWDFRVRVATNLEDAVSEALGMHRPDIVCLDLHIPATPEEFAADPTSGQATNGLRVLERIRLQLPGLKVLIPTAHHNRDDLREWVARIGVPVSNMVPKGSAIDGAPWEGHLLLTVSRLRDEIRSGAVLPALPPWRCPVVQVLDGSDLRVGKLCLRVNGNPSVFRGKEGRLAALVLKRHGDVISYGEIDQAVWGKPVAANTRNQKINDVRAKIRTQWLSVAVVGEARPELQVLETVEGGLILHAYVEWLSYGDADAQSECREVGSSEMQTCQ